MLPRRRPLWLLVLAVMLIFGFYQEKAKIQLNHYVQVLQENPGVASMSPELRAEVVECQSATQADPLLHHAGNMEWLSQHEFESIEEPQVGIEHSYSDRLFRLGWLVLENHRTHRPLALVGGDVRFGRADHGCLHRTCPRKVWLRCGARILGFSAVAASVAVHCPGALAH